MMLFLGLMKFQSRLLRRSTKAHNDETRKVIRNNIEIHLGRSQSEVRLNEFSLVYFFVIKSVKRRKKKKKAKHILYYVRGFYLKLHVVRRKIRICVFVATFFVIPLSLSRSLFLLLAQYFPFTIRQSLNTVGRMTPKNPRGRRGTPVLRDNDLTYDSLSRSRTRTTVATISVRLHG